MWYKWVWCGVVDRCRLCTPVCICVRGWVRVDVGGGRGCEWAWMWGVRVDVGGVGGYEWGWVGESGWA